MRRVTGLAIAAAAAVTLTACGNTATEDTAGGPELPDVQSEVEANASADAAAESEVAASSTTPATNERGNLVKGFGEEGGITSPTGEQLLTFAVDSITPDAPCTGKYAEPAENGHIIAIALRVSTSAALTADNYISVSPYDFKFIGSDGITVDELATAATYSCFDSDQTFTSDGLGPAQMYVGNVVIDAPEAAGTLVFDPSWGQMGAWEYNF
ncbi:hypothetical protein GCM10027300_13400 [Modestobacter lapidis]